MFKKQTLKAKFWYEGGVLGDLGVLGDFGCAGLKPTKTREIEAQTHWGALKIDQNRSKAIKIDQRRSESA